MSYASIAAVTEVMGPRTTNGSSHGALLVMLTDGRIFAEPFGGATMVPITDAYRAVRERGFGVAGSDTGMVPTVRLTVSASELRRLSGLGADVRAD